VHGERTKSGCRERDQCGDIRPDRPAAGPTERNNRRGERSSWAGRRRRSRADRRRRARAAQAKRRNRDRGQDARDRSGWERSDDRVAAGRSPRRLGWRAEARPRAAAVPRPGGPRRAAGCHLAARMAALVLGQDGPTSFTKPAWNAGATCCDRMAPPRSEGAARRGRATFSGNRGGRRVLDRPRYLRRPGFRVLSNVNSGESANRVCNGDMTRRGL